MRRFFIAFVLLALFGFRAEATIGVWVDQGTVISTISGHHVESSTVLYESGCVIVASPCFKIWGSTNVGPVYSESTTGLASSWNDYASNPIISFAAQRETKVFKNAGTYYLYTGPIPGGPISVYTATDGVTFTLQNATAISVGTAGAVDANWVGQLAVVGQVAGVWHGYYGAQQSVGGGYVEVHATSPDLINWTKDYTSQITAFGPSNFHFYSIGGIFYGWSQVVITGIPNFGGLGLPSDIMRYAASSPAGPWTALGTPGVYRTQSSEGVGLTTGQVADPTLVQGPSGVYMFFTAKSAGQSGNNGVINLVLASGQTLEGIVQTYEGIQNVPIPGTGGFELNGITTTGVLASDNFNRANANPIGGNWTPIGTSGGWGPAQLISNAVTSDTASDTSDSSYNAISWPNDQWSQTTVVQSINVNSFVGVTLRATPVTGASTNYYSVQWFGKTGSAGANAFISKRVNGTGTNFLSLATPPTVNANDTITGSVIGTTLSFFVNRNLVGVATDSSFASGKAGFRVNSQTATSNAIIDNWSGGGFSASPSLSHSLQVGAFLVGP